MLFFCKLSFLREVITLQNDVDAATLARQLDIDLVILSMVGLPHFYAGPYTAMLRTRCLFNLSGFLTEYRIQDWRNGFRGGKDQVSAAQGNAPLKTEKSSDLSNYFFRKGHNLTKWYFFRRKNVFGPLGRRPPCQEPGHKIFNDQRYSSENNKKAELRSKGPILYFSGHHGPSPTTGIDIYVVRGEGPPCPPSFSSPGRLYVFIDWYMPRI